MLHQDPTGQKILTGSPTATLSKDSLLIPAFNFTLSLKVSFGFSSEPYTVPAPQTGMVNKITVFKIDDACTDHFCEL